MTVRSDQTTPIDAPWWPDHLVVALYSTRKDAQRARSDASREGIPSNRTFIFRGPDAAERMGKSHRDGNVFRRLARFLWLGTFIDALRFRELEDHSRRGGYVVAIQADDDEAAKAAAHVLSAHGGREVTRFSRAQGVQVMGPQP